MDHQEKNYALLPSGFADILPPEAQGEADAIQALMQSFAGFGYERVKPPLVEFEDSLFAPGPGAALIHETFRVMDPVSHKMMGVRSDITAQIARIAMTRLGAQERPLRLSYANDVLRTKASQQRLLRQFCQVGCEIIGDNSLDSDVEGAIVGIIGLKALGLENITIDIAMPRMVRDVLDGAEDLKGPALDDVKKALSRRDLGALRAADHPACRVLEDMLQASGPALQALERLSGVKALKKQVDTLGRFFEGLQTALDQLGYDDVTVTLDALENRLYEYHNGVAFTYFAAGVRGELGRGGRYVIQSGDTRDDATGFTLYMDTVRQGMKDAQGTDVVAVPQDTDWAEIMKLRGEGQRVVRVKSDKAIPKRATHVYKNGKVQTRD